MNGLYTETNEGVLKTCRRIHANGEQTHVAILSVGDRDYVAVAYDIRPSDFTPIAAEAIGYDPTIEGVVERVERWLDEHPKGVAYEGSEAGGSGGGRDWKKTIMTILKRLNEYGNRQREQITQANQEVEAGREQMQQNQRGGN